MRPPHLILSESDSSSLFENQGSLERHQLRPTRVSFLLRLSGKKNPRKCIQHTSRLQGTVRISLLFKWGAQDDLIDIEGTAPIRRR